MKNLLIIGASGFLGWNLCNNSINNYKVYGMYNNNIIETENVHTIKFNLNNYKNIYNIFNEIKPDIIIYLATIGNPNYCEQNPEISNKINLKVPLHITKYCLENSIKFIYTSTDLVFDGLKSPYSEKSIKNPINIYGTQKAKAEEEILNLYSDSLICRLPLLFGYGGNTASSFIQGFLINMRENKELKLFTDEYRTPASGDSVSKGILIALEKEIKGILNLGGKERISRYDFGLIMKDVFNIKNADLKPSKQSDVQMTAKRPPDVSLDSSKAFSLGYSPKSIENELKELIGLI